MRRTSRRKGNGVLTIIIILVGILIGYGVLNKSIITSSSTPIVDGEIDTSRYVKLSMLLAGPPSTEAIMAYKDSIAQLNNKLKDSINANVEITYIPFDEMGREYPKIFSSKETYDVVYASSRAHPGYFKLAEQENFKELDELLPIYAKNIWANINPAVWDDAKYKGKIYGIPLEDVKYRANSFIYREDLLEKYEMEPLMSLEDMEEFMDNLLIDEVDITPIGINESSAIRLYDMLVDLNADWIPAPGLPQSSLYLVSKSKDNITDILFPVFSNEFMEFAKEMKDWADKGYWQKEALVTDSVTNGSLELGKDGSIFGNIFDYSNGFDNEKFKFFCFGEKNQKVIKESAAKNLLSINADSRHAERALMVIDAILNDQEFNDLITYGIQGEIIKNIKQKEMLDYYESISIEDPYAKFTFDASAVEEEINNVIRINSQYGIPILLGKAGDPVTAVNKYREKLKAAGIEKIIDAVEEQLKTSTFVY